MKKRKIILSALLGLCSTTILAAQPAHANNEAVERALATYGDVSTFYAAALNTGVLSELDPNKQYTVFAPTNEAFAKMRPDVFPCFYSAQCRGPVADMVRDHIVVGEWDPKELVRQGTIQTLGPYRVFAESPFVGDYTVGNAKILSNADMHGVMLYRINDVILHHKQIAAFQASTPPSHGAITTEKVVTTYSTTSDYPVPGGGYAPGVHEVVTEKTYVTPTAPHARSSSTTVVYPDGE